jgi:hypothetical protein
MSGAEQSVFDYVVVEGGASGAIGGAEPPPLAPGPVLQPVAWREHVHAPPTAAAWDALRGYAAAAVR